MTAIKQPSKQNGFTLIELVLVIVILGVLGIATSKFIVFGTQIYIEATDRQHVLSKSRFLVERLTRELRASVPNSIRISNDNACINFLPIKASGAYRDDSDAVPPPFAPNVGKELDIVSWSGTYLSGDRLYIYPQNSNEVFRQQTQWGQISKVTEMPDAPNYRVAFSTDEIFTYSSPNKRFYTANSSVYFCLIDAEVYRYETSISSRFQRASSVRANGSLMAQGLTNIVSTEPPFTYREGALFRNSVVNLYFEFAANLSENMFFNQEVHIPNVP